MRTRDKIRVARAFRRGMSMCEILLAYRCVKSRLEIENAIRHAINANVFCNVGIKLKTGGCDPGKAERRMRDERRNKPRR